MMEKFLRSKNELILTAVGILLLILLIFIFIWSINFLAINISAAITSGKSSKASANFDLTGAQRLNLKGLVQ
ncbi:MAG TPA: hypothetical protein VMV71_00320 [Candidatus Paceibacterota bacterium]|nr:hypothetical protein [Candidatus Paceibacterota bacterium]